MFTPDEKKTLEDLVVAVSKMPPPPPMPASPQDVPYDKIRCACGDLKETSIARVYHTGVIQAVEVICSGCRKDFEHMARIVCASCRQIVGWIKPGKDDTGFVFQSGKSYHVEACGYCNFEVTSATIIEKLIYKRKKEGKNCFVTTLIDEKKSAP